MRIDREAAETLPRSAWIGGTASRMFLVLSFALLPLAIVALVSTLSSIRVAHEQKMQLLAAATEQSAGKLESDVMAVQTASHLTVQSLMQKLTVGDICGRLQIFVRGTGNADDVHLMVVDRAGRILCPPAVPGAFRAADALGIKGAEDVVLSPELDGLLVRTASTDGQIVAATLYRKAFLDKKMRAAHVDGHRNFHLQQGARHLDLNQNATAPDVGMLSASAPVGKTGLTLTMAMMDGEDRTAQALSLLAPLAMWFAAAFIGWLVVRWVLIQPLVGLRQAVGNYRPGETLLPPRKLLNASREIAELGITFEKMSAQVAAHEGEMRQALERQTSLTREVHHRVKNNLQIISSLINLHARAARDASAARAYVSIQRRVDSLAVVQRNHYAELDDNRGVSAPPLIAEIAATLKSSVTPGMEQFNIEVDCDPVYLHQDVAAPVAFMIAELADLAINRGQAAHMRIALTVDPASSGHATLAVTSDTFRAEAMAGHDESHFFERVLTGLSRQLRAALEYDGAIGEYRIRLTVL